MDSKRSSVLLHTVFKVESKVEEKPVFNPITFSENSNYCWEKR